MGEGNVGLGSEASKSAPDLPPLSCPADWCGERGTGDCDEGVVLDEDIAEEFRGSVETEGDCGGWGGGVGLGAVDSLPEIQKDNN